MKHIGLFEGIGGFSFAAKWMGWETIAWCEINPFGQQVLKHHYPEAIGHGDIKTTDFSIYRGKCDILTGGFPCQPFSAAGKRKGTEDDRHLWPEMLRAIREIQPKWIVGENVGGIVTWSGGLVFEQVQADLETEGYEVQPFILPAAGVNAPHRRDRVWFIAYSSSTGTGISAERRDASRELFQTGGWEQDKQLCEFISEGGTSSNACRNGCERSGATTGIDHQRIRKGLVKGYEFNTLCCDGSAPNTTSLGKRSGACEQGENVRSRQQLEGAEQGCNGYNNGTCRDASDSCDCELQGRMHKDGCFKAERLISTRDARDNPSRAWDNFPTQSPVRRRDDGIPSGLSGITISKHRNESLKAYGNAIVPEVAIEIFKAIQSTFIQPQNT